MAAIVRPNLNARVLEFTDRLMNIRWIAERVLAGQQFNAYLSGNEDEDEEDTDDTEYHICLGPVSDFRVLCTVEGGDTARLIESALKVATEAFLIEAAKQADAQAGAA